VRRWAVAAGVVLLAGAAGSGVALVGGLLGAGCTQPTSGFAGCGGGSYADGGLAGFCAALAAVDCTDAIVTACYGSVGNNRQTCVGAATESCVKAYAQGAMCNPKSPRFDVGSEYTCDCLTAHGAVYATASLTVADFSTLASACRAVFNSGCLEGVTCTSDADCDVNSGLVCVTQSGPTGTCQVPAASVPGDRCTDPTAQCTNNSFCADGGKCVADLGVCDAGAADACAPCSDVSAPCFTVAIVDASVGDAGESFGVNGARCVDGACRSKLQDGAHCAADVDCVGGFCVAGACKTIYTFGPSTPPTQTAPGCAYFLPSAAGTSDGG
jgi:hypothetical protein